MLVGVCTRLTAPDSMQRLQGMLEETACCTCMSHPGYGNCGRLTATEEVLFSSMLCTALYAKAVVEPSSTMNATAAPFSCAYTRNWSFCTGECCHLAE